MGCAMAQAVSGQPLTGETWAHTQVSLCGIYSGQSGTGTSFSLSSLVFSCHYHSTGALYSYHLGG
jgi:hypothetical protein